MNTIDLTIQFSDKKNIKVCIRKGRKVLKGKASKQTLMFRTILCKTIFLNRVSPCNYRNRVNSPTNKSLPLN